MIDLPGKNFPLVEKHTSFTEELYGRHIYVELKTS
jgi:hypothetical protein